MFVQIGQNGSRERIALPHRGVLGDHLVEAKGVKELSLISVLPPHHSRISCRFLSRNHCSLGSSTPFSTASVIFGLGRAQLRGPLYLDERTSSGRPGMSEKCQKQKFEPFLQSSRSRSPTID